jgi:tetratricopeptide (TPR) repeat protein
MLGFIRDSVAVIRARLSRLSGTLRLLVIAAISIVSVVVLFWLFDKIIFYFLTRSYVDEVAQALDINKYLANAIAWVAFAVTVFLVGHVFSLSKSKRRIGIVGLLTLLVGQSLVLWYGTRGQLFDTSGNAIACYVITRDAVHPVRYGNHAGTIDPETGLLCRAVTPEMVERLRAYEKGERPEKTEEKEPVFFDPRSGEAIVWYYKNTNGGIELFNLMGFYPSTGEELVPVTKEIAALWKSQSDERRKMEARRAPQLISDPEHYEWFNAITGEPRVWYIRKGDGSYEFYDRAGFYPSTGEALTVATSEVKETWLKENSSKKCYIITRDAVHPVRYGKSPGTIDPEAGRLCRSVTPEMIERLRAYETGERPKRTEEKEPVFFDPRTGEAILWYYKNTNGDIELFNLMGFHPNTGDELLPVTKAIYELWTTKIVQRIPKRVDLKNYEPFDSKTGQPRIWYWRSPKGDWEFYDSPGFHPGTGEQLTVLTKDAIEKAKGEAEAQQKRLDEERAARDKAKKVQAEIEEQDKRERARIEEDNRLKQEAARLRETGAANQCDALAGNPSDPKGPRIGVAYNSLKAQASEAVSNCEIAVRQYPTELRFQYQLGRALEFIDRKRAFDIHQKLVGLRYPAAYDNLGTMYLLDRKNVSEAVRLFRMGTQLGDPDSMISLAERIGRGDAMPTSQNETKIALYGRAAALGNVDAVRALQVEQEKALRAEQQLENQQQQQRRMMQFFGGLLQNMAGH